MELHLVVGVFGRDGLGHVLVDGVVDEGLPRGGEGRRAGGVHVPGVVLGGDVHPLVAQQEVPHRLGPALGDREGNARQHLVHRHAPRQGGGVQRVLLGVIQHRLGQRHAAMGRINVHPEVREALEQLRRGGGQRPLVLRRVLAGDHLQRLLARIRIRAHAVTGLEAGGGRGQPPAVGGDAAVGIGGRVGAHQGQAGAELLCFTAGDGGQRLARKGQGEGGGQHGLVECHISFSDSVA
ncbi:hypothetical protein D3C81_1341850 [compost metagenome]